MADDTNKRTDKSTAEIKIEHYKQLSSARSNWDSYWQTLHDYFYVESNDVSKSSSSGSELDSSYLWDGTTLECADVLASGFMNYLTPASAKWGRVRHKNPKLSENKSIADYFSDVTDEVHYALHRSNFYNQIFSSYKASGVYGTSILLEEEDLEDDIRFTNLPIKQVCIVEDARGRITEYYIEFEYTAYQAATRWGRDKLSKEMQDEVDGRKPDKKHKFLLFIGRRDKRDIRKTNKENLPIEASWIDVEGKRTIDEGGYNEMPAMCHQFDKRPFEVWGYSPAMKSLPFARLLNAVAKTNLRSMMKHTDPPMAMPDNAFIVPLNMNPRAVNYYKKDSIDGKNAILPLGNYGNPDVGMSAIEYYTRKVKSLMYYDTFLAFDELEKQMNNPEVIERINEKMSMLAPAVGRYTSQVLNPIFVRTIGILFRRGRLPEPPDELIQDPNYEIDFVGQLAQAQKRSELNALNAGLTITAQIAQFNPEVLDKINPDRVVDETWGIVGAPIRVLRSDTEIEEIRQNRMQQQAKAQELMIAQQVAMTGKDAAQADKHLADAKAVGKK